MPRRTFEISQDQDEKIGEIAGRVGLDKSDVVRLALGQGLPIVDEHLEGDVVEKIGAQLQGAHSKRISKPSVKRRS